MNTEPVTLTRILKVSPHEEKTLRRLEFDPGLNTERIDISYRFTPGNVVDMGLMINDRINGWSGGARKTITLSENFASPGYQRTSAPASLTANGTCCSGCIRSAASAKWWWRSPCTRNFRAG